MILVSEELDNPKGVAVLWVCDITFRAFLLVALQY